jgi:hypothetical protein
MSNGGAQFLEFGPYIDANGDVYTSVNLTAFDAPAYSVAKTFWTDEAKTAAVTTVQGGTDGTVSAYFDGDYSIRIKSSDDVTTIQSYPSVKITSDTATMWEGNFGTVTPAASANAKGQMFLKLDGSDNIIALQASNGSAFTNLVELTASGIPSFDNIATKIMPVANVKHPDYGAIGDGSVEDDAAIQKAIDDIQTEGGGIVWIPEGTYKVANKLVITSSNVTLQGCNMGASIIKTNSATADILELGDGSSTVRNLVVRDIAFSASVTRSAGAAIDLRKVINTYIQNVWFEAQFTGIGTSGANTNITIDNIIATGAIEATGHTILLTAGRDYFMSNVITDNLEDEQPEAGIRLRDVSNVFISTSHFLRSGHGILIDPPAGDTVSKVFISDCKVELGDIGTGGGSKSGVGKGIYLIAGTATSTITNVSISNTLCSENAEHGIMITGHASSTVDGVSINNCKSFENLFHGIALAKGINVEIEGCTIAGNDSGDSDTYNGINVTAGVTLFKISGNTIGQSSAAADTQNLGINIAAGASDEFQITGNTIVNNKNGSLTDASTGDNKVIDTSNLFDAAPSITQVIIASATTTVLPVSGDFFFISGTATISGISNGWTGRRVTLEFLSTADVNNSAGLRLAGAANWTTIVAQDTLTLMYNSGGWVEVSRSVNT